MFCSCMSRIMYRSRCMGTYYGTYNIYSKQERKKWSCGKFLQPSQELQCLCWGPCDFGTAFLVLLSKLPLLNQHRYPSWKKYLSQEHSRDCNPSSSSNLILYKRLYSKRLITKIIHNVVVS